MLRAVTDVRRILIPLDHSPGYEAIVDYACVLARGLGATLTLLHVYTPPNAMVGIVPGATIDGEVAAEVSAGDELLDRAAERIRGQGIATVERILERASPPGPAIVGHATAGKYDLIIMGTHARKGVARLVLGSTAEQVLRDAPCPVLSVHLPRT